MFGKCLQKRQNQDYKAILFTIAIITNEKETKMKHKIKQNLTHIDASFLDTKQLYSNLPESRNSRRRRMLVSSQITLAENTWCLYSLQSLVDRVVVSTLT